MAAFEVSNETTITQKVIVRLPDATSLIELEQAIKDIRSSVHEHRLPASAVTVHVETKGIRLEALVDTRTHKGTAGALAVRRDRP